MKKYIAEGLGTFALVFCGTGSIVLNDVTNGSVTNFGVAISFGFIVAAMIYAFGNTSGAHINPAVTIGFALTDIFDKRNLLGYIGAQLLGAFAASILLRILFQQHQHLGATIPSDSWQQAFILELVMTYILMLVILVFSQSKSFGKLTGLAVGATVGLEAYFAGPMTGASMNPARSIAPAIVSGDISHLWLYIISPILGAILASITYKTLSPK